MKETTTTKSNDFTETRELYQDALDAIRRLGEISNKRNRNKVAIIFMALIDYADLLKSKLESYG